MGSNLIGSDSEEIRTQSPALSEDKNPRRISVRNIEPLDRRLDVRQVTIICDGSI